MRLGILDAELGICAIDSLEDLGAIQERRIKEQMPEGALPYLTEGRKEVRHG